MSIWGYQSSLWASLVSQLVKNLPAMQDPIHYTSKIHLEIEHFPAPSIYFQGLAKYLTDSSYAVMLC